MEDSLPEDDNQPTSASFLTTYKLPLIFGSVSIIAVILSIVLLVQTFQTSTPIEFVSGSALGTQSSELQGILVDVEGAVASPGAKTLPVGSRVEDALNKAGGISNNADTDYVAKILNRAQILTDGMKIYVPPQTPTQTSYNPDTLTQQTLTSHNISTTTNNQDGLVGPIISINFATAAELDTLPGVGPATVTKIIANRPYQSLDELVTKKSVGKTLFDKIKNRLSL